MNEPEESDDFGFPWLADEDYQKACGQLRLQIGGQLRVFDCYGLGVYIQPVTEAILELAEDFGMRVRGEDRPIDSKFKPHDKPTD